MTRATAIALTVLDALLALVAVGGVFASSRLSTLLLCDLLFAAACVAAIPLLHYWIEGRP